MSSIYALSGNQNRVVARPAQGCRQNFRAPSIKTHGSRRGESGTDARGQAEQSPDCSVGSTALEVYKNILRTLWRPSRLWISAQLSARRLTWGTPEGASPVSPLRSPCFDFARWLRGRRRTAPGASRVVPPAPYANGRWRPAQENS